MAYISSDASVFEIQPKEVVYPGDQDDLLTIVKKASKNKTPITMRAGGTSLGGQSIGQDLIIDISKHLTSIISINGSRKEIDVEPGVIQDDLNDYLRNYGLHFAPDTSTSNRAMIGGMIGNNSCGSYSLLYGTTREHVKSVDVILSDGSLATFSDVNDFELNQKLQENSLEGRIYNSVISEIKKNGDVIMDNYPDQSIIRRNTGYALDVLYKDYKPFNPGGKPFNLTPLICGSEGTLAIVRSAKLNIVTLPDNRGLICAHYDSMHGALNLLPEILKMSPVAVEMIDKSTLDCTKDNLKQNRNRFWINGDPEAVLVIEWFFNDGDDSESLLEKYQNWLLKNGSYSAPVINEKDFAKVWDVRKAGLGLLMGEISRKKAVAVIEDAAVPVANLADYFLDVKNLMKELNVASVYYGHVSVGLIHIRPKLDLKNQVDRKLFRVIAAKHSSLVKKYRGSLSGEHGDGRIRAPFLKEQLGDIAYQSMVNIKNAFDPRNILNPDVILGDQDITTHLRADRNEIIKLETGFDWSEDMGFLESVEKCNGAGACRKSAGRGVMCPSYQVTREENYSTRGRSNLLRRALTEDNPLNALSNAELLEALDLCLGCKGCKSECPASVDMAKFKSEVLYQIKPGSALTRFLTREYGLMLKIASRFPSVFNWVQNRSRIKKILGIDERRNLPKIAGHKSALFSWWYKNKSSLQNETGKNAWVLCDLYSQYWEPGIGAELITCLSRLGLNPKPIFLTDSPRALISNGFLDESKRALWDVFKQLTSIPSDDYIIGIEPSEVLLWRDEIKSLLPDQTLQLNRIEILLFEELILMLNKIKQLPDINKLDRKLKLHIHCHQKSLMDATVTEYSLGLIPGLKIEKINSGCCGMSGDFGYKHYDISKAIAEQVLIPEINGMNSDDLIVASGTSCRHQIEDLTSHKALHVAQVFSLVL